MPPFCLIRNARRRLARKNIAHRSTAGTRPPSETSRRRNQIGRRGSYEKRYRAGSQRREFSTTPILGVGKVSLR